MGYGVSIDCELTFKTNAAKTAFKNAIKKEYHCNDILDFATDVLGFEEAEHTRGGKIYTFIATDINYNEQDDTLMGLLTENNINAVCTMLFRAEDHETWRYKYENERATYESTAFISDLKATEILKYTSDETKQQLKKLLSKYGNDASILKTDVIGHTKYLQGIDMPIMVNSICNENTTELKPSAVCEMHIGIVDNKKVVLITPQIISM